MKFKNIVLCAVIIMHPFMCAYDRFDLADALHRIEKYINLIDQFNRNNKKLYNSLSVKNNSICPEYKCEHALTKLCLKRMATEPHFLEIVVETWHLFKKSFYHIETELFIKEFLSILYSVYHASITALSRGPDNLLAHKSFGEIIIPYNKASTLTFTQIVEAVDQLYISLKAIMVEYGFKADSPWSSWIKHNWWMPPVVIGAVVYTIAQRQTLKRLVAKRFSPIQEFKSAH